MTDGINKSILPKRWETFFKKGSNALTLSPDEWKDHQILWYLMYRFKEMTGREFACQYTKSPTSSSELYFIKALKAMMGTSNGSVLKQYIDWIFEHKLPENKLQLRSLNFLNIPALANEFLAFRQKSKIVSRTTTLPSSWMEKAKELDVEAETYGDVAFIELAVLQGSAEENYKNFYRFLLSEGFHSKDLAASA